MPVYLNLPPLVLVVGGVLLALAALVFAGISRKQALRKKLLNAWGQKPAARQLDEDVLEDIGSYHHNRREFQHYPGLVDDLTWQDLDGKALFHQMNLCQSMAGSEVLYDLLRDTAAPAEELQRREERIQVYQMDEQARIDCQVALHKAGKAPFHGAARQLFAPSITKPDCPFMYYMLAALPFALVLAGFFLPLLFLLIIPVLLVNAILYFKSDLRFLAQAAVLRQLGSVVGAGQALSKVKSDALNDQLEQIRALSQAFPKMKRWLPYFRMERGIDPMAGFMIDFYRIFFLVDMVSLCHISGELQKGMAQMRELYRLVGQMDAEIAIAAWRNRKDTCVPVFHEGLSFCTKGLVHPLLENAVPNDFTWDHNCLLTGSNASGKSTFIKALAINAILAQTIHTCTASSIMLCRSRVMTAMAVKDSILEGDSYYIAEIKALKRILDGISDQGLPLLCLVDEILRGTNTVERIAASVAVLRYFPGKNVLCINATHDVELTGLLGGQYHNYHFTEELRDGGMVFTYTIHEGPATGRNAISLLQRLGFEDSITKQAEALAQHFDQLGTWVK